MIELALPHVLRHGARALCAAGLSLALAGASHAQSSAAPAGSHAELVTRLLAALHPEDAPLQRLQAVVFDALKQAKTGLDARVTPEKRDVAMKDIAVIGQKTLDETMPLVREASHQLENKTVGKLLGERFSDDELKQLIAIFESPVRKKFEQMLPELQRSLGEAVTAQTRPQIAPKLTEMGEAISRRLREAVEAR